MPHFPVPHHPAARFVGTTEVTPRRLSTSRRLLLQAAGLGLAAAAVGSVEPARASPQRSGVLVPGASERDAAWASRVLARMTLEQKVGQVFNVYVYGTDATTVSDADRALNMTTYGLGTPAEIIQKYCVGGIIYFAWSDNVNDPQQIARLSNSLQAVALDIVAGVPLAISVDQEQGLVNRIGYPATQFPGAMALGATRSTKDAVDMGRITGEELRAMGITQDFAPDADVNLNPANPVIGVRSPGGDPTLVSRVVAAEVKGFQQGTGANGKGVVATAKHFPGHGDTGTDSHYGLPVITHTLEQWQTIDQPPFQAAIDAGVQAIMSAHLSVPALDATGDPATLSQPIITGILRNQMGFTGLVVTDGLAMAGVRAKYGDGEVAVRALLAGCDMLLQPPALDVQYAAVLAAVRSGRLPLSRLDEAVTRNLQLKSVRRIVNRPYVDVDAVFDTVGTQQHLLVADRVADDSITMLRNQGVLPLAAGASVAVLGWSSGTATHAALTDALVATGLTVTATVTTGNSPTQAQIGAAVSAGKAAGVAIVTTYNVTATSSQVALVQALQAAGVKVVVVAVRNPYDINQFPTVDAYLATYSYSAVSMKAVARTITGSNDPQGLLPVAVPTADGTGTLYAIGAGIGY